MTNIILDTNIIITYPRLLGLTIKNIKFIIPSGVVSELNEIVKKGNAETSLLDLVQKADYEGTVKIINNDSLIYKQFEEKFISENLKSNAFSVIITALGLNSIGEKSKIASLDFLILKVAHHHKIEIISKSEIESFIETFKKPEQKPKRNLFLEILLETIKQLLGLTPIFGNVLEPLFKTLKETDFYSIQGKIVFFERKENVNLVVGILIGILCTLLGVIIYMNSYNIVSTINVWGTISCIIILGIILFLIREKQRLGYGVFEFLVGVLSVIMIFYNYEFDYSKIQYTTDFYLKIAAGLYIMVRGQDNIVKATKNSKFGLKLQKIGIGL